MPKLSIYVVKFGGSLFQSKYYDHWLDSLSDWCRTRAVVIVPGGGKLADEIRHLQQAIGLSNKAAHELALDAMRCQGKKLSNDLRISTKSISLSGLVSNPASKSFESGIWVPSSQEFYFSRMPENWSVTSDSIALWLANEIRCTELLLLKSCAPVAQNPLAWSGEGYVDDYFSSLIGRSTCPIRAVADHEELR